MEEQEAEEEERIEGEIVGSQRRKEHFMLHSCHVGVKGVT